MEPAPDPAATVLLSPIATVDAANACEPKPIAAAFVAVAEAFTPAASESVPVAPLLV